MLLDFPHDAASADADAHRGDAVREEVEADERGRVRTRSVRRKARSMSPFRTHWRTASHVPAAPTVPVPEHESADEARQTATPAAPRSSSSSSTASSASSASSSSSRGSRRWGGWPSGRATARRVGTGRAQPPSARGRPGRAASARAGTERTPPPGARGRRGAPPLLAQARVAHVAAGARRRRARGTGQGLVGFEHKPVLHDHWDTRPVEAVHDVMELASMTTWLERWPC